MGTLDLYPSISSSIISESAGEVDLRDELADLLRGEFGGLPHGQTFILRRARRGEDSLPLKCSCVDPYTGTPDLDTPCPYCLGEGVLFDEETFIGYSVKQVFRGQQRTGLATVESSEAKLPPGVINQLGAIIYTEYFVVPTTDDVIVEIKLDLEGLPVTPIVREAKYKIVAALDFRSDNGRVEFWKLFCSAKLVNSKNIGEGVVL